MYIPHKLRMLKWHLFKRSDGEFLIRKAYRRLYKKELNAETPVTFSEKLFSRMVKVNQWGDPRFTRLADKYLVREYVKQKIGEKYLIGLLWSGTKPEKIPFDSFASKCVVKTNHGSGGNIVLGATTKRSDVIRQIKQWMSENYYWTAREFQYYKIPRRILVEAFIDDGEPDGPLDYRFWCFNGKPEVIQVDNHLHDINPFYDVEWNKLDLSYRNDFKDCDIKRPANLQEMLEVAALLSSEFDFVRVDLYNVKGTVYFGELTFTPVAGNLVFKPESWDAELGSKW